MHNPTMYKTKDHGEAKSLDDLVRMAKEFLEEPQADTRLFTLNANEVKILVNSNKERQTNGQ